MLDNFFIVKAPKKYKEAITNLFDPEKWRVLDRGEYLIGFEKKHPTSLKQNLVMKTFADRRKAVLLTGWLFNRRRAQTDFVWECGLRDQDASPFVDSYTKYGREINRHFDGYYNYVIVDLESGEFEAGASSIISPPFYYGHLSKKEIFACNNLLTVFTLLQNLPDLDEEYFTEYWCKFGASHSLRTPYVGVNKVQADTYLRYHANQFSIENHRSVLEFTEFSEGHDAISDKQKLKSLLFESVAKSINPEEETLIDLSGGLDSSTIVCVSAELCKQGRLNPDRIKTISYWFSQSKSCREDKYWNEILKVSPFKNLIYDFDANPPFCKTSKFFHVEPNLHILSPATEDLLRQEIHRNRGKVILRGIGGDEVLSGYSGLPIHLAECLREGGAFVWLREAFKWLRHRKEFSLSDLVWKYSLSSALSPSGVMLEGFFDFPDWLAKDYKTRVIGAWYRNWAARVDKRARKCIYHIAAVRNMESYYLPSYAEIEARYPLLTRDLVTFMVNLPWHKKINHAYDRLLQRESLTGILPEKIRKRKTKTHMDEYLSRGIRVGKSMISQLLDRSNIFNRGYNDKFI